MKKISLKGNKYVLLIEGNLKKSFRKQSINFYEVFDYVLYWYEGFVEIIDKNKKLGKFKFKTSFFRDYWTESILDLKSCFIYFEQESLFYKRFYEGADDIGVKEGKFYFLIDEIARDLLNQVKEGIKIISPKQFKLLDLVEKNICYKNKFPLKNSEIY